MKIQFEIRVALRQNDNYISHEQMIVTKDFNGSRINKGDIVLLYDRYYGHVHCVTHDLMTNRTVVEFENLEVCLPDLYQNVIDKLLEQGWLKEEDYKEKEEEEEPSTLMMIFAAMIILGTLGSVLAAGLSLLAK